MIRSYAAPLAKKLKRRKGPKRRSGASKKQREALQDKMENYFEVSFNEGITRVRNAFSAKKAEAAFRSGDYDAITELVPWGDMRPVFDKAVDVLGASARAAADIEQRDLPKQFTSNLRLTTQNEQLDEYLNVRTGALIQGVKEDTQVMVQNAVRGAFTAGLTPADVAAQIKSSIGLDERRAQALQNFQGTKKQKEEYAARLQEARNMTIARTEISFATNKGQLAVYQAMREQGIVPENAEKVWIVDGKPCPNICDPMEDMRMPIDAMFTLPDGEQILCPPAHPNCRCLMSLDVGDSPHSGREPDEEEEEDDGEERAEDDEP